MKKGLLFVATFALVLLLAGCGSSKSTKLVCTTSSSGVDITFNIGFEGNKVTSMDFSYDMDLSSYNDTQIAAVKGQDFCEIVKSSMSSYANAFTSCKQDVVSKHLKVDSVLDPAKVSDGALVNSSVEDAKKGLESQGYTCVEK